MEPTLLNKLILIFVIFLIGVSIIDGFTILTPKIIEGNTNEAIGCEDIVRQNAGDIALLKKELDILSNLEEDIDKTNVGITATNKSVNKQEERLNTLIEDG